jgi:hypothetical protein
MPGLGSAAESVRRASAVLAAKLMKNFGISFSFPFFYVENFC